MIKITRSFQARMIFSILLIAGLTWVLGLTVIYIVGKRAIEKSIGLEFQHTAEETSKNFTRLLEHHVEEAYAFTSSPDILDILHQSNRAYDPPPPKQHPDRVAHMRAEWSDESTRSLLAAHLLQNPASHHLQTFHLKPGRTEGDLGTLVIDEKGIVVAATAEPMEIYYGDQPWWENVLNVSEGKQYISDIEMSSPFKNVPTMYTLSIATPIYDLKGDRPIGVLLMVQSVKEFFELVTQVKLAKTDHTMLAGSDGNLLFCPIFLVKNHTLEPELVQKVTQPQPGWGSSHADVHHPGERSINGFAPVVVPTAIRGSFGGHRWYIFTSQDPKETYAPIQTLLSWVAGIGLLGMGLLAFFISYATGRLVQPIMQLRKGAKQIAQGELQAQLDIRTGDEIEELAADFNEMAAKIKVSYTQLEQKVAQRTHDLAAKNKELSALYMIASTLSKSLNLKELLDEALSTVLKIFGTEAGMIHLLEEAGGPPRLTSTRGFSADGLDPDQKQKDSEILYRQVIEKEVPISSIEESLEEVPFKETPYPNFITIPIRSKGKILGTLTLLDRTSQPFIRQDLGLLVAIGNQIGVAVENIRLYEETKKVDQLKSDFVSKVSHEFRTPLTSIKGFIEILLSYQDIAAEKQQEFLQIINQESDRLIRLINDVLDISKIEAGKIAWKVEPLDLVDLIDSTVRATHSLVDPKKIALLVETEPDLPPVLGDRDHLIQVLNNLLSNAIKFTERGQIVLFAQRSGEDEILAGIRDTGIGLPQSETTKIFNKFYQVARPEKGLPKGTGLGLAICREIISHLNGKIWCESAPGEGCTFYFTLPTAARQPERETEPSPS
ncbi:ATP-binding protein [Candidatus Manganitrophus noduliformans]|uniref:histidine kinase n=1 Tax=Candidatus Manganitrophus noduliformans TaxID=2606439 RepID=A0A7X6IC27_9BACT|nr:ATP-binding protein [Candidatus Manganitrophus noduliformans]NKE72039.1 HAMP domain-containing protein [Candidatus Manganitrophus noduliformans]